MDNFLDAQLSRHYDELDRLEAIAAADQQPLQTWYVITSAWEEHASDRAHLGELLADAATSGLQATVETIPF